MPIPEGLEPLSTLPRAAAEEAVDRTLRTTHDAIRFTDAAAQALGPRGYECEWVKPGGSRRLYARDPDRPGWIVAQCIVELSLDVPPPPPWADEVLLPDGTRTKLFSDRPKPQPEGPDQRSAELRLIEGERVAQWAYDQGGRWRERARGRGDGNDSSLPFLHDPRRLDRDSQRPHPLFLRDDLDPDGHSPRELAAMFAALDFRRFSAVRVWMPHPMPGGPALAARRAVWELRKASFEGRFAYPAAGWIVLDGYVADVVATGATFDAAFAAWQDAVRLHDPVPRDTRTTPEERARAEREFERALEQEAQAEPEVERLPDGTLRTSMRAVIRFEPPVQMPFPPHRPECCPAVAIHLPDPPELPAAWRAAGFTDIVRLVAEDGECAHGFVAREPHGGYWFVGEVAARQLDPATLRDTVRAQPEIAFPSLPDLGKYRWRSSEFTVLAPGGRALGPLVRTGGSAGGGPHTGGFEPPARFMVIWSRPA